MKTKRVNRYYCDFCKKSSGAAWAMERHEAGCTANPDRQCGMCEISGGDARELPVLIALLPNGHEYLRRIDAGEKSSNGGMTYEIYDEAEKAVAATMPVLTEATEGCPACILAALRQSGCARFSKFDWKAERESFLAEVNHERESQTYYG